MIAPTFSIIVPTYARPNLLVQALQSVVDQRNQDYECIVVDDGSRTARAVLPADSRFKCIDHDKNRGNYAARNSGVAEASGEVICFLDDDDLMTDRRLDLATEGLRSADIALCWSAFLDAPTAGRGRHLEGQVLDVILDATVPHIGTTAIRRTIFVPFDEAYTASGELEWWLRQGAVPVHTVPEVGYLFRRHHGVRSTNSTRHRIEASERLLTDHGAYFARHRRARSFRHYRLGVMCLAVGERRSAFMHLLRSLTSRPSMRAARQVLRIVTARGQDTDA